MEDVNPSKYTAAQLRRWLQQLNLPTTGTKNTLLLRLQEIPENERGVCPADNAATPRTSECDDEDVAAACEDKLVCAERCGANSHGYESKPGDNCNIDYRREYELVKKELEIAQRERELLVKQNEMYKKMERFELLTRNLALSEEVHETNEGIDAHTSDKKSGPEHNDVKRGESGIDKFQKSDGANDSSSGETNECGSGGTNDRDGANNECGDTNECAGGRVKDSSDGSFNECGNGCGVVANETKSVCLGVPFPLLKDLLPEYDGSIAPSIFVAQIKNIKTLYAVDEDTIKALLMAKVKGRVQSWLYSKPNFVHESLVCVLDEMLALFGEQESKLAIRRKFEVRKWQIGEDFLSYFNNKISLADRLGIPEDELIEYIIDGIPDNDLKMHANLQCFQDKAQILRAFSKVSLKRQPVNTTEDRKVGLRCYNCNCLGHYANECQKPRREVGACYGCGSMDHLVAACPDRKTKGLKNA